MEERENISQNAIDKMKKKRLIVINILICIVSIFFAVLGVVFATSYRLPKNLKEATGTISEYNQQGKEWYDYIGSPTGNYFNVIFEDGTFFEAKGISYDNIDLKLYEEIKVGEEIKITYNSKWSKPNQIFAIEYNGVNYLLVDDVLSQYENEHRSWLIAGIIIIVASVTAGGVGLFFVNYKYRKKLLK